MKSLFPKERHVQVLVRDNNVDQALKVLKKKMQREGVFREMRLRRHYEKPSEQRVREKAEAIRRARKLARKKLQREGLLPPAVLSLKVVESGASKILPALMHSYKTGEFSGQQPMISARGAACLK